MLIFKVGPATRLALAPVQDELTNWNTMRFLKICCAALALGLVLGACNKNNEAAKNLDGSYSLDSWAYEGNGGLLPPGEVLGSDTLGVWDFTPCKVTEGDCEGSQTGFLGTSTETFEWRLEDKGTSFIIGGTTSTTGASAGQLAGKWDVITLDENTLIATSSTCGTCFLAGQSTITFTKN
jgi:hypothetical protein